ncbi:aspartyl/asparaginyl beta-hydroxylase domain-containing protein [Sphingomonas sp. BAUL-RG-20F-R05-02]|uniref:aspartyl/asparaginyl beta-hydroxylase domain-containing protein n=1 Tax=Sphingomonas sp. BAUL-RG-20F-R05-02 TaxID=2914830 RepID=UPI001F579821|nr:aspartyl/asparaginyl beta-hydroxylase domain-containing protein [Sphingomonas sp. BAUL-RG-20F-R05-02]
MISTHNGNIPQRYRRQSSRAAQAGNVREVSEGVVRVQSDPGHAMRQTMADPADAIPARRERVLTLVPPANDVPLRAERDRPFVIRLGKRLRGIFDRVIAASSLVSNDAVLDVRDFAWTAHLRDQWQAIRDEALGVALQGQAAPCLAAISPDHRAIARANMWRTFFLWGYGYPIEENIARCPATAAAVRQIPGLATAFFSILAPGAHIPDHRGVTKGLITCHLALIVLRDGDVRMRVGGRVVRWAEGETLVFDDTYPHEVWNDTSGTQVVLLIQFRRPLRNPGKIIADVCLGAIRRSAFVQDARDNIRMWNETVKQTER